MKILIAHLPVFDHKDLEKEVLPLLTGQERDQYSHFVSQKRKTEWLAVRHLLIRHFGYLPRIVYSSTGKPSIPQVGGFVSISHSHDYAIICLSDYPCAVDVDREDRNYSSLAHRFLSGDELQVFSRSKASLALSWIAKEAMFKLIDQQGVDFSRHLRIYHNGYVTNFGYFYGEYLPTGKRVKFTYYRLNKNIIVLAEYDYPDHWRR